MKIFLRFTDTRSVFERLYQLYCYETGSGSLSEEGLYPVPECDNCIVEQDGKPIGFAVFSGRRRLRSLFLIKSAQGAVSSALFLLFDADTGEWSVPDEYERFVNDYTSGAYTKEVGKITFDNSARFDGDGSYTDCSDADSVVNAFRINAEAHGRCILEKRFADAAGFAARLFMIKQKASPNCAEAVVCELLRCGGSVGVWTAGYALQKGIKRDEALAALRQIADEGSPFSGSAAVILSEYGGQML